MYKISKDKIRGTLTIIPDELKIDDLIYNFLSYIEINHLTSPTTDMFKSLKKKTGLSMHTIEVILKRWTSENNFSFLWKF